MNNQERMIGESSRFLEALEHLSRLAPLNKPALIIGERGTGKELAAARIHYLSERWGQAFLKLNCASISEQLIDSELFGHEAGAFSGATGQHKGFFERADGGTLFLDELATTSAQVQEKLLRVIEHGEVHRLGGKQAIKVDVRLIAATNENLPRLAHEDKFRADLLDRLAFDVVNLPPLRDRPEDILILADFFALGMTSELKRDFFAGFSDKAKETLTQYKWPGNIRELKNVVERSVYRCNTLESPLNDIIIDPFKHSFSRQAEDNKPNVDAITEPKDTQQNGPIKDSLWHSFAASGQNVKSFTDDIEKQLIEQALRQNQYNQKRSAKTLGLSYDQLRGQIKKFGLNKT